MPGTHLDIIPHCIAELCSVRDEDGPHCNVFTQLQDHIWWQGMQFEVAVCHVRLPGLVTFEKLNHRRGAINLAFKASSSKRGK